MRLSLELSFNADHTTLMIQCRPILSDDCKGEQAAAVQALAKLLMRAEELNAWLDGKSPQTINTPQYNTITPAEYEVWQHLALGKTNKEIARDLGRNMLTVKTHIQHLLLKTGSENRKSLAKLTINHVLKR